jgi:hypothetical protein
LQSSGSVNFRFIPGVFAWGFFVVLLIPSVLIRWYIVGSLYAYKTISTLS